MSNPHRVLGLVLATLVSGAALPALAAPVTGQNVQVAQAPTRIAMKEGKAEHRGGEHHPEMMAAKRRLEAARAALQKAAHDYHGHRAKALELTNQAIKEIEEGLAADKK